MRNPQRRFESLLVVTYIRPECPFTTMECFEVGDIVTHVNGERVRTLEEYARAWKRTDKDKSETVVLKFYDGAIACAARDEIINAEKVTKKDVPSAF